MKSGGQASKREGRSHVVLAVSQCVIKFCTLSPSLRTTGNLTGTEPGERIRGGESGAKRTGPDQRRGGGGGQHKTIGTDRNEHFRSGRGNG